MKLKSRLHETDEVKKFNNSTQIAITPSLGECSLGEIHGTDQNASGNSNSEELGSFRLSNEEQNNGSDKSECSIEQHEVSKKNGSTEAFHREVEASSPSKEANSVVDADTGDVNSLSAGEGEELNDGSSSSVGAEELIDGGLPSQQEKEEANNGNSSLVWAKSDLCSHGSDSTCKSSSTEHLEEVKERISHVAAQRPAGESSSPDTPFPSPNEQLQQAQGSIHHRIDRARSTDTLESVEIVDPSSELSGVVETFTYPTARSNHAYDGSISSSDGMDDQFLNQHLNPVQDSCTVVNTITSEEMPRRDKLLVDSMIHRDLETQQLSRNTSSDLFRRKHYAMKHEKRDQGGLLKTTRNAFRGRNWMRTEREENSSRTPYQRSHQYGYENGSLSNQVHDKCNSSFYSADISEDPELEKIKLLKMVYELQDQLKRTSYLNGKTNGRISTGGSSKEKHALAYHSHEVNRRRVSHGLNYHRCPGRCSHGDNWHQKHKFSRIPFSREATSSRTRNQVDHSYFKCCPQDWQCSAQLPAHYLYQNKALCMSHPGYISHTSCSSSPQRYTDSEFATRGRETKSSAQRHRAHEIKKSLKEKQSFVKRHLRPMAGGAPFLTCWKCLKLLQLPADFLLFKRRCHRLKCGACSEVLEFSLHDSSHIVSYPRNSIDPPPSEVDDNDEVINRKNVISTSHFNRCPHANPVSCSDDYGLSVCRSCSSATDPVPLTPDQHFHPNAYGIRISNGSSGPRTEKDEFRLKHLNSKKKAAVETHELVGPSSSISRSQKLSLQHNKLPPQKGPPLHRLMGYSSPAKLIKGSGSGSSGEVTSLYTMKKVI
ncbi:Protein ENHANCED DISEASE RESISTANCE 4 [Quillaja saponaria]|uniref:Protein ENHANCED DISEASE RESISTANCE 4 n=1 Tax=Quillaja saponaria TaxID=32244 RepID=A0AAD7LVT2_QUISA|nr:Protein ENHANCED DISEASE RESISTANCE 4 [Quillaja saponaria]